MAHCLLLSKDLFPTFWRVPGTSEVVVSLWRVWPYGRPADSEMLTGEDVREIISGPLLPSFYKTPGDRLFASGDDFDVPSLRGLVLRNLGATTFDGSRKFRPRENWAIYASSLGHIAPPVERFLETMDTKLSRKHLLALYGRQQLLMFAARLGADNIDDPDIFTLFRMGPLGCVTNMDIGPHIKAEDLDAASLALLPTLAIDGPSEISNDSVARFTVQIVDPVKGTPFNGASRPVEVHLEATAGYLPRRRVTTKDGIVSFELRPLDLMAGDVIKLKAGFWNFSGAAEKIVQVV